MPSQLKVLHVITSLRTGGAERLMVDLLPRLRERGLVVELAVLDGTQTDFRGARNSDSRARHGCQSDAFSLLYSCFAPFDASI